MSPIEYGAGSKAGSTVTMDLCTTHGPDTRNGEQGFVDQVRSGRGCDLARMRGEATSSRGGVDRVNGQWLA